MTRLARIVFALLLMAMPAIADWETVEVFDRGYITAAVHKIVAEADSEDVTPPIIDGDTLDTRGFMIGYGCPTSEGEVGYALHIRYREAGLDGWYRWNQWLECDGYNFGMPLIGSWSPTSGDYGFGMTPFMPIANVRLLRLLNPVDATSISTVTIWFIEQREAKAADWSAWDMPN